MKLMPLYIPTTHYSWSEPTADGTYYYALVGNVTGHVHAVFKAETDRRAYQIKDFYESTISDAGYTLMKVDGTP